jgi:hypothetical protein
MTTEQEHAPADPQRPERQIVFRGREMWVRPPKAEQILVLQRTMRQLQQVNGQDWTGHQVLAAAERLRKIVDAVIVHRTDIDFLDDLMLEGELDIQESVEIVKMTIDVFAEDGNREQRRATAKKAPARKAARRKAS